MILRHLASLIGDGARDLISSNGGGEEPVSGRDERRGGAGERTWISARVRLLGSSCGCCLVARAASRSGAVGFG